MFTGLIEACVPIARREPRGTGLRLCVASPGAGFEVGTGQSIAVSGVCLSVAAVEAGPRGPTIAFDVSSETLARTWLWSAEQGRVVNLERALRLGDRLDGHLVAGHVDGVGRIVHCADAGDGGRRFSFEVAPGLERYLIDKGSITIDGISLTVVSPRGRQFDVAVIPQTLARTSLARARAGDEVNLEADLVGKWLDRLRA